jgi:hypothetical protein
MAKEIIQIGHNINGYHFGRCSFLSWKPQSTACIKFNKQSKKNFQNRTMCTGEGFHISTHSTSLGGG